MSYVFSFSNDCQTLKLGFQHSKTFLVDQIDVPFKNAIQIHAKNGITLSRKISRVMNFDKAMN